MVAMVVARVVAVLPEGSKSDYHYVSNQSNDFKEDNSMKYDYNNKVHQWIGAGLLAIGGVLALTVIILVIVGFGGYNDMVEAREEVNLAESNVQTMMQRRVELIPDLLETVKASSAHDEKIVESVSNASNMLATALQGGDKDAIASADDELTLQVRQLNSFMVKNYPELTAGQHYTMLMDQLEGSVNRIAVERENYNLAVSQYNTLISKMPNALFAGMFGFEKVEPFKADESANQTNLVDFGD